MRKPSIGAIVAGVALLALIGGYRLSSRHSSPPATRGITVVDGSIGPSAASALPLAPATPAAAATSAPHDGPAVAGERGAINYADKGVLPPL